MKSMTGYGKGSSEFQGKTVTIEIKSVNNRYIEMNSRLPKSLAYCENDLRQLIGNVIKRGSVEVYFNLENNLEERKKVEIDMFLAAEYVKAAKTLRTEFVLDDDFNVTALLRSPDILKVEQLQSSTEVMSKLICESVALALSDLDKMRMTEGETIKQDLTRLTENIVIALKKVADIAVKAVAAQKEKLTERIKTHLKDVTLDEGKLINEVAFLADKCDINEEIQRLSSHINQFVDCLNSPEPMGRKMDFISQEMNREINTMGSKSADIELTNLVVQMKNELEKIKEQIRNVE